MASPSVTSWIKKTRDGAFSLNWNPKAAASNWQEQFGRPRPLSRFYPFGNLGGHSLIRKLVIFPASQSGGRCLPIGLRKGNPHAADSLQDAFGADGRCAAAAGRLRNAGCRPASSDQCGCRNGGRAEGAKFGRCCFAGRQCSGGESDTGTNRSRGGEREITGTRRTQARASSRAPAPPPCATPPCAAPSPCAQALKAIGAPTPSRRRQLSSSGG